MKLAFLALSSALFAAAKDPSDPGSGGGGAAAAPTTTKVEREKANGVTRPSPGTNTGKVWEIADSISEKEGRPATRAEVVEAGGKAGLNPATVTTQFGQWRRFYGIKKELVEKAAKAPKEAKPKKGKKADAESSVPEGGVAVTTNEDGEVEPA